MPIMADPSLAAEVKNLAQKIAGQGANDQLQQIAARFAETQIDLARARSARLNFFHVRDLTLTLRLPRLGHPTRGTLGLR